MKTGTAVDYAEFLRSGRWFRALPADFQEALLAAATLRKLTPDHRLFSRGDPPSGIFAVLDGAVRIGGVDESGKEALLTLAEPPYWFGEIAIIDGLPRTHDAIAEGETLVAHVPQIALAALLDAHPQRWRDLALLVTSKLRMTFGAIEDLTLMPAAVRLARRLVMIARGHGDWLTRTSRVLEVKQEQLAMMLSMSRQSANQLLKQLEAKGLIKLSYGEIEIVDLAGLLREGELDVSQ